MQSSDFFDKLSREEQASYLGPAVEMHAYILAATGDPEQAKCVYDWYFRGPGPRQLVHAASDNRDQPIDKMVYVLIRRQCKL